jgi:hypothetical protein
MMTGLVGFCGEEQTAGKLPFNVYPGERFSD